MRTFLACSQVCGRREAVRTLEELVRQRNPDAILFAGGLFSQDSVLKSPNTVVELRHQDTQFLEDFFATLGAMRTVAAVIPGPNDVPLRAFLMAGMHARSQSPGVHLVHCTMVTSRDIVIAGIGGELTQVEDSNDPTLRCSRTTADYFLQAFLVAPESEKVLLLNSPPNGQLGGDAGNSIAAEVVDSYHPKLCIVSGPNDRRGIERLAHTTVVNPGALCEGSAAWIDWSRVADEQVEML